MDIAFIPTIYTLPTDSTRYHMTLTHLVLKYDYYAEFYKEKSDDGDFVILDNSLIELGGSVDIETVQKAAELINPTEIVLPDVFRDKDGTIKAVDKALKSLEGIDYPYQLQAVCHGSTPEQWISCWETLNTYNELDCIAIPKVTTTIFEEGRPEAVRYALSRNVAEKEIHLLGVWEDMKELQEYTRQEKEMIRGVDTSIVIHSTIEGSEYFKGNTKKPNYKINLEKDYEIDFDLLNDNKMWSIMVARSAQWEFST